MLFDPHGTALPGRPPRPARRLLSRTAGRGAAPSSCGRSRARRARAGGGWAWDERRPPPPLDGTLFRPPLRTRAQAARSRLSARAWLADDGSAQVDDELGACARLRRGRARAALFLQHVEEIAVYVNATGGGGARPVARARLEGLDAAVRAARARAGRARARAARLEA